MAANSNCRGITSLGKRVANQILTHNPPLVTHALPPSASALAIRRTSYSSVYDKNFDDQVRPAVVPDYVIQAAHSDKYWAPHPQTGIFGPPTENPNLQPLLAASAVNAGAATVLEENFWFRPTSLEDSEKPHHLA